MTQDLKEKLTDFAAACEAQGWHLTGVTCIARSRHPGGGVFFVSGTLGSVQWTIEEREPLPTRPQEEQPK